MGILIERKRQIMMNPFVNCPYVHKGLIFWLDGIYKGGDATKWRDLISGITFAMTNATFAEKGVTFGNSTTCAYAGAIGTGWNTDTIEAACSGMSVSSTILYPNCANGSPIGLIQGADSSSGNVGYRMDNLSAKRVYAPPGWKTLSLHSDLAVRDLVQKNFGSNDSWGPNSPAQTTIGYRYRNGTRAYGFSGTIYCIRIYNRHLTKNEMIYNQRIDNTRFGLGLEG